MKRVLCAMLLCALCACALAGCGSKPGAGENAQGQSAGGPGATDTPEEGAHGETDQSAALDAMPTLQPVERLEGDGAASDDYFSVDALTGEPSEFQTYDESALPRPQTASNVLDASTYQYSALVDTTLGFTFNYPNHWENVPGVFTVCYREKAEEGKFPARVAISAKKLVHSPEGTVLADELSSYMRMVYRQYDPKTFQVGTPSTDIEFLGKPGTSNTYLAYWGETEVKGFVIGRPVGRILYVFHFCASYEDYTALENVMRYMLKSVELVQDK
ncbi:MAG: hypothetical protein IKQ80_00885 [Clostridia bacterium]|nr:hypothetical protein [Clostridia bacterium]MBR6891521.1 hypothetical protein [Clostridia bacterium]